jgi:ketosteroid isomerase-like protein
VKIVGLSRISLLLLLGLMAIPSGVAAQDDHNSQSSDALKAEMLKADEAFNQAVLSKDIPALNALLADKLSWIARGDRLDKAQVIADFKSENLHFNSLSHDELVVQMFGTTAVVTGHSTSVLEYKGKSFTSPRLFTSVYMKLDGRWQLVAHQVSELAAK